jgi:anti-sigma B factor antagonist
MTDPDSTVFEIERHGDVTIIRPSAAIESIRWDLIEQAAEVVLQPIHREACPLVIVALNNVNYFGSVFLSLLLRCWKHVSTKGGTMVLCGVSKRAQELLRVTALDTLWAIYDTQQQAIQALESD